MGEGRTTSHTCTPATTNSFIGQLIAPGPMLSCEVGFHRQEEIMKKTSSKAIVGIAMVASLTWGPPAIGQGAAEQELGTVHFVTSCNEPAQQHFDRAMRYQHSFWYRKSREAFEQVLQADPQCAIAHWGIALSLLFNPHIPPPKDKHALSLAALQKGPALPAP